MPVAQFCQASSSWRSSLEGPGFCVRFLYLPALKWACWAPSAEATGAPEGHVKELLDGAYCLTTMITPPLGQSWPTERCLELLRSLVDAARMCHWLHASGWLITTHVFFRASLCSSFSNDSLDQLLCLVPTAPYAADLHVTSWATTGEPRALTCTYCRFQPDACLKKSAIPAEASGAEHFASVYVTERRLCCAKLQAPTR